MMICINKAHYPVTTLGYGKRIGIWTQGCGIRCKGCVSRDTWGHDPQKQVSIDSLIGWCQRVATDRLDGITISGGEPFEQPGALLELLSGMRRWTNSLQKPIDILCYSGLPLRKLMDRKYASIIENLDVLIPEPYIYTKEGLPLRGSANQSIQLLSEMGRKRYSADVLETDCAERFQVAVDQNGVWFVGIPARGDMVRIDALCRQKGMIFHNVSWRA